MDNDEWLKGLYDDDRSIRIESGVNHEAVITVGNQSPIFVFAEDFHALIDRALPPPFLSCGGLFWATSEHEAVVHATSPADTLKTIRETLCLAQSAINHLPAYDDRKSVHVARLGRLIDDIDRQRPLGPDGGHGERHTPTCGCEA